MPPRPARPCRRQHLEAQGPLNAKAVGPLRGAALPAASDVAEPGSSEHARLDGGGGGEGRLFERCSAVCCSWACARSEEGVAGVDPVAAPPPHGMGVGRVARRRPIGLAAPTHGPEAAADQARTRRGSFPAAWAALLGVRVRVRQGACLG